MFDALSETEVRHDWNRYRLSVSNDLDDPKLQLMQPRTSFLWARNWIYNDGDDRASPICCSCSCKVTTLHRHITTQIWLYFVWGQMQDNEIVSQTSAPKCKHSSAHWKSPNLLKSLVISHLTRGWVSSTISLANVDSYTALEYIYSTVVGMGREQTHGLPFTHSRDEGQDGRIYTRITSFVNEGTES